MPSYFAEAVRLPNGWALDVRLHVDADGIIAAVEPGASASGAERLSGPVIPGMPNLHSHAFQRAMAGLAERGSHTGDTFWTWRQTMYRFLERLTPEDNRAIACQLYVEMLKGGYTTVGEFHYLHNDPQGHAYMDPASMASGILSAAQEAGIGLTLLPVLYMTGSFDGRPLVGGQRRFAHTPDSVLRLTEKLLGEAPPEVRVGLAPHSLRAVPLDAMREALAGLDALDRHAPIHIHVAEQPGEVADCLAASGKRSVELLLDSMDVTPRWTLIHATHMTEAETRRAAATGATVGLCPSTEANLGDGLFQFLTFLEAGGAFGIGTDSHVSLDAREELRWLDYGQRLRSGKRAMPVMGDAHVGARLWLEAVAGGARSLGHATGHITVGHRADLLVLDPDHPSLAGREGDQLLDALVFVNAGASPIRHVMARGRMVIADGRHPDEEAIAARYRAALSRLLAE